MVNLSELGKDATLAGVAGLIFFKIMPAATALGALILIVGRIIIAWQEYRINRRKLGE